MDFYYCLHIPTGKIIKETFSHVLSPNRAKILTIGDKLALVNRWNIQGENVWKYWVDFR